jgi:O-antigen/teichoic acid export membrane protein
MRLPSVFSRSTSFFANTAWLVGGSGLSQVLLALAAPLLTRLYTPADFGAYAVLLALVNFIAVVASLRYETAIVLPRTERQAANLAVLSLAAVLIVATLSGFAAALAWWGLGSLRGVHFSAALAALVPFSVAALGVQQVTKIWLMRAHLFGAVTVMLVLQSVVMIGLQVGAALAWGSDAFYLASASVLAAAAASLAALPALWGERLGRLRPAISARRLAAVAQRYRRFPLYTAPYSFVAQISQRGPVLLLAVLGSAAATGGFALAQRIIYLPITVVVLSLSQAFYRRAAGRLHEPQSHELIRRVLVASVLIVGPAFAVTAFDMKAIFAFLFGENWREAGGYGSWLALASFVAFLTYWLDRVYDMLGRQRLALALELTLNVTSLSLFALVLYLTKNAQYAVMALALTIALYATIYLAITLRIAGVAPRAFVETVLASLAMGMYGAAIHYGLRVLVSDPVTYYVLLAIFAALPAVPGILIVMGKLALSPLRPALQR